MADYIKRELAIEKIIDVSIWFEPEDEDANRACDAIRDYVEQIPAADVRENVRGEWIVRDNPGTGWYRITCSNCGEDVTSVVPTIGFMPNVKVLWDFCPNCGAQMVKKMYYPQVDGITPPVI